MGQPRISGTAFLLQALACYVRDNPRVLSTSDGMVALLIISYMNAKEGYSYPSISTLSGITALSERTVARSIARLHKLSIIRKDRRGNNMTNRYFPDEELLNRLARYRNPVIDFGSFVKGRSVAK